jgi:hypothetical protein
MQSKSIFQTLELLSTGKMRPWGVLSCIAFTLLIHSNLFALDWTNGATDNWNSSNWDGGAYTTNNNAYIDNGTLTIAAGENIQMGTGQLRLAKSASSSAFLIVNGSLHSGLSYIGHSGMGNLLIQSGNFKNDVDHTYIGQNAGSDGYMNLSNANFIGSTAHNFCVGKSGDGTFVASNSHFHGIKHFYVGFSAGSTGNVFITSSNINVPDQHYISNASDTLAEYHLSSSNLRIGSHFKIASGVGSQANVNIINSNIVGSGSSDFYSATNGCSNVYISGSNLSALNILYFSNAEGSSSTAVIENSTFSHDNQFHFSYNTGTSSNTTITDSVFKMTDPSKDLNIGRGGNTILSASNTTFDGYNNVYFGQHANTSSNVVLNNSKIVANNIFRLAHGDNSSANITFTQGSNLTVGNNDTLYLANGSGSHLDLRAEDSYVNLSSHVYHRCDEMKINVALD